MNFSSYCIDNNNTLIPRTEEQREYDKKHPETVTSNKMILAFDCSKDIWPIN